MFWIQHQRMLTTIVSYSLSRLECISAVYCHNPVVVLVILVRVYGSTINHLGGGGRGPN